MLVCVCEQLLPLLREAMKEVKVAPREVSRRAVGQADPERAHLTFEPARPTCDPLSPTVRQVTEVDVDDLMSTADLDGNRTISRAELVISLADWRDAKASSVELKKSAACALL